MSAPIDLAAANAAGAAHGQIASTFDGGVALSCHKLVEEDARAQLLILPGILRIDVRPLGDGIQVVPRPLGGIQLGWDVDASVLTDYGKRADQNELPAVARFRIALWSDRIRLAGRLLLGYTAGARHGPTHFVGHVVIVQVPDDR